MDMRRLVACGIAVMLGCGGGSTAPAPSPQATISALTGAAELLDEDGPVIAIGARLPLAGNFQWTLEGSAAAGYVLVYGTERRPLHAIGSRGFEVTAAVAVDRTGATQLARLRVRGDGVHVQLAELRRGTVALPGGPMSFVLLGDGGSFNRDDEFVAFDLDRDGAIDFIHLDSAELFHVFEREVALDGVAYALDIAPAGDRLTLHRLDHPASARPLLRAGTAAPDATVVAADTTLHLASLRGRVVLLDFWAPSCAPCMAARPRLAALRAKLHDRGFEVVAITDTPDGSDALGIDAVDKDAEAVYRIDRYPSYFLIDRAGTIACAHCALDKLEPMIEPLL
jgi:thiol-disulfide isomerase/thioredoxin